MKNLMFTIILSLLFASCATLINGPTENVSVTTNPADAMVTDGKTTQKTPATFVLERNREYVLTITKQGFQSEQVKIQHVISGWVAGNLISFGVIGTGIDVATGSIWSLEPHDIRVSLHPLSDQEFYLIADRLDTKTLQSKLAELDLLLQENVLTIDEYNVIREITIQCVQA
jgi:hypothetical protein